MLGLPRPVHSGERAGLRVTARGEGYTGQATGTLGLRVRALHTGAAVVATGVVRNAARG